MAGYPANYVKTSDLKSRILHNAQTSVYMVKMQPPTPVSEYLREYRNFNYNGPQGIELDLACMDASLPGSSLSTHEMSNDYHGVTERNAYRRMYDQTTDFTFMVNRDYDVMQFFDGWMDFITQQFDSESYLRGDNFYRMSYPDQYKSNTYISKFEKDEHENALFTADDVRYQIPPEKETYLQYTFVDSFPTNIIQQPVSYGPSELLKYTVSMTYLRYVRERKRFRSPDGRSLPIPPILSGPIIPGAPEPPDLGPPGSIPDAPPAPTLPPPTR